MSVVYFIGCSGRIKIGVTRNLKARVCALKTSAPAQLDVIATIPGTSQREAQIHNSLRRFRISGEWFADCDDVRKAIADAVSKYNGMFNPDVNVSTRPIPPAPPEDDETDDLSDEVYLNSTDIMIETIRSISLRFGALIDSPLLRDFSSAIKLEADLRVRPGSILEKIYPCDDPIGEHRTATDNLRRCYDKFGKVSDRISLCIIKQDCATSTGLCRAAEVLIERAEDGFAKLKAVHQPIVNQQFRAPKHRPRGVEYVL